MRDFEKGRRTPIRNNLDAIRQAIEAVGLRLIFDGGAALGVALAASPAAAPDV